MPAYRILTVVLMMLLAITAVELMAPGAGMTWFGSAFTPAAGPTPSVSATRPPSPALSLAFITGGVCFWMAGKRTRAETVAWQRRLPIPSPAPSPRAPPPLYLGQRAHT